MTSPKSNSTTITTVQGHTYPYTVHRVYLCGHPDEYIKVDRGPKTNLQKILHTIVPQPHTIQGKTVRPYRQTLRHCKKCAEAHRGSVRHPKPLAAHQSQSQGGRSEEKNGFTYVLMRERFSERGREPIRWPDERETDVGHDAFRGLKGLHEKMEIGRNFVPHDAISYEERTGRRIVEGPKREGSGKLVYVVQTAVDSILARGLGHRDFENDESEAQRSLAQSTRHPQEENRPTRIQPSPKSWRNSPPCSPSRTVDSSVLVSPQNQRRPEHSIPARPIPTAESPSIFHLLTQPPPPPPPPPPPLRPLRQPLGSTLPGPLYQPNTHQVIPDGDQIARNRALALQHLEGHLPTTPTRHSDSAPALNSRSPHFNSPVHDNVPSYISHQRPFGPIRSSGSTTLSHGDEPREYDRKAEPGQQCEPGVSINDIIETLFPSSRFDIVEHDEDMEGLGKEEGSESAGLVRDMTDGITDRARRVGRGSKRRASRGSLSSFESQRYSGARGR